MAGSSGVTSVSVAMPNGGQLMSIAPCARSSKRTAIKHTTRPKRTRGVSSRQGGTCATCPKPCFPARFKETLLGKG